MSNQNLLNIINPPAHVIYSEQEQKDVSQILFAEQKKTMTDLEFMRYITHDVNNKKLENGRINFNIGDKTFALSISPHSNTFEDNIEEKIKPLVMALKQKRYLTYSSCEGHGIHFRRYIGLAFADEESREYFYNYINSLKLPGVLMNLKNTVSNIVLDVEASKNRKNVKIDGKDERAEKSDEEILKEVQTFNIQFHKTYQQYFFLELEISQKVPIGKEFFQKFFFSIKTIVFKFLYMEKNTKIITDSINSNNFKKYKY